MLRKGSIVWSLITNGSLENQVHPRANWLNTLKLAYGQTHQQKAREDGDRYLERPQKSTGLIGPPGVEAAPSPLGSEAALIY